MLSKILVALNALIISFLNLDSFMECDEDFGVIDKYKKQVPYIFIPNEWKQAICRASRKFVVKDMSQHEFKSISAMDEIIVPFSNVKKDDKGAPITWWQIKLIRINKDDPLTMNFKYTLDEECEFRKVSLKKDIIKNVKVKHKTPPPSSTNNDLIDDWNILASDYEDEEQSSK
ncbi:hypothetical protein J6590_016400 [Homalodisca vitripennis]|nr:hypothetical protein J6590_016400 [Homalodisca vitripennis]